MILAQFITVSFAVVSEFCIYPIILFYEISKLSRLITVEMMEIVKKKKKKEKNRANSHYMICSTWEKIVYAR